MKEQAQKKHRGYVWIPAVSAVAVLACILIVIFAVRPTAAAAKKNLMDGVVKVQANVPDTPEEDFVAAQADFSVRLFQKTAKANENSLISPVSVSLALGMTANGAGGTTRKEFETILGSGMDLKRLNLNLAAEADRLKSDGTGKFSLANSIWYRDKALSVKPDFLRANAEFFGAAAYQLNFADKNTPQAINEWVKSNTGGKIDKMVDKIDPLTVMYLINAMYLEQDWASPYATSTEGIFHTPKGDVKAKFMGKSESYLCDSSAEGILKPFKDDRYAFAAILPKQGIDLNQYVKNMTGGSFLNLMRSDTRQCAIGSIPKFEYDFSADLNQPLKDIGLKTAFDGSKADFSGMASTADGNIYIDSVKHKAFIQVDELGIKAGAATNVAMTASASARPKYLDFNRPFLYAVIDTKTQLPVLLGTVVNPAS